MWNSRESFIAASKKSARQLWPMTKSLSRQEWISLVKIGERFFACVYETRYLRALSVHVLPDDVVVVFSEDFSTETDSEWMVTRPDGQREDSKVSNLGWALQRDLILWSSKIIDSKLQTFVVTASRSRWTICCFRLIELCATETEQSTHKYNRFSVDKECLLGQKYWHLFVGMWIVW